MSLVVVKVGGAVAGAIARQITSLVTDCYKVVVVHGAGPQISAEMERRGLPVVFVGVPRSSTTAPL